MSSDQMPAPGKTELIKFPPSQAGKDVKCPGYARGGGGCLSFDLTGTLVFWDRMHGACNIILHLFSFFFPFFFLLSQCCSILYQFYCSSILLQIFYWILIFSCSSRGSNCNWDAVLFLSPTTTACIFTSCAVPEYIYTPTQIGIFWGMEGSVRQKI